MNKDILTVKKNSPAVKAKRLVELQAIYNKIKPEIDALKADLLQTLQEQDVYTLKTGTYTLSRAKRVTPFVSEFHLLKKSLDLANIPYETQEVFIPQMNIVFRKAIDEGRDLPGLTGTVTEYVAIRVKEPKGKEEDER